MNKAQPAMTPSPPGHIWIASFPRSGNTFFRLFCAHLLRLPTWSSYYTEGSDVPDLSSEITGSAKLPQDWSDGTAGPVKLIKTHDAPVDDAPAIYLLRHGMRATDSWFHYLANEGRTFPLAEVIGGATQFGSWASHVRAWDPQQRPRTLLVRFEDFVTRPEAWVETIASFCGVPAPDQSTSLPAFAELHQRHPHFFREGRTEGNPHWDAEEIDAFVNLQGETMRACGYDCPEPATVWSAAQITLAKAAERHAMESARRWQQVGQLAKQLTEASVRPEPAPLPPPPLLHQGPSDRESLQRLAAAGLQVTCVFDIGASNSAWSRQARALFPEASFHLFEPLAEIRPAYKLGLNAFLASFPGSKLHAAAVGAAEGDVTIHVDSTAVGSTVLEMQTMEGWSQHSVPMITLRRVIEQGAPVPAVIKIDTQGSELNILQGLGDYLEQVSVLFLETWLVKSYQGKVPLFSELVTWLAQRGFYPWEFGEAYRDPSGLLVAPDVVFLNVRCPQSPNHWLMHQLLSASH